MAGCITHMETYYSAFPYVHAAGRLHVCQAIFMHDQLAYLPSPIILIPSENKLMFDLAQP